MFWNKSPKKKLEEKYKKLMNEAFELSKTDRSQSDKKYAEADLVSKELEKLMD